MPHKAVLNRELFTAAFKELSSAKIKRVWRRHPAAPDGTDCWKIAQKRIFGIGGLGKGFLP